MTLNPPRSEVRDEEKSHGSSMDWSLNTLLGGLSEGQGLEREEGN